MRLPHIAESELGKTLDKARNTGDPKPYLCSINIYWTGIELREVKQAKFEIAEQEKYRLKDGDLLICEGGDVGRCAVWHNSQEMYYQNALHRVRFWGSILPEFFKMVLEAYKGEGLIDEASKGMTIKHFTQTSLYSLYFPLPSIEEQRRILNQMKILSSFLTEYTKKEDELSCLNASLPSILKKSILQEAIQGKLVPQDPNDEPASILLERIRKEKARLVKEGKLKPDKHESIIFRRDNSHYEKLDGKERCIDDEIPFEIPPSWCWCRLQMITANIHYGYTASATHDGNAKLLRITDIQNNSVVWEKVPYCSVSKNDLQTYQLHNRDIMIARTGGTIGKTYIVRKLTGVSVFASYLIRAIPVEELDEEYLKNYMESPLYWKQLNEFSAGTGQPNVNGQSLKRLLLPLPPLQEQHRIVKAIERLFSYLDK